MITNSPHTNAVTRRPAEVGPERLTVHALSGEPEHGMVRTPIGSFADGMTTRSGNGVRTVGSFAIGMARHPQRSRARTGSFADGLVAVSERVRARIGRFADGMTADGLGEALASRRADIAPGVVPAWDGSKDAVCDTASAVAQEAVAA
jgi:hypothetical protein